MLFRSHRTQLTGFLHQIVEAQTLDRREGKRRVGLEDLRAYTRFNQQAAAAAPFGGNAGLPFAVTAVEQCHLIAIAKAHHPAQVMGLRWTGNTLATRNQRVVDVEADLDAGGHRVSLYWRERRKRASMADTPTEAPRLSTLRAYARLARLQAPVGFMLLMWPCWWAVALAGPQAWQTVRLVVLFFLGALVMRAAGCVWNDIVDRDFDARVARTRDRPIASGRISVRQGLVFMVGLALIGLAVLLTMGTTAIVVGMASLALILPYPLMKRITWWPQAWLGITFNWGALVGWAAATGSLAATALAMYAAGIAWTLGYDTIYAHQDKADDALIGVKSSARRLGPRTKPALRLFYALTIAGLAVAATLAEAAWPTYLGIALGAGQLAWQIATLDTEDTANCWLRFRSNSVFAALVFLGFLAA